MSLQLAQIVLYGRHGDLRVLPFNLDKLSVITGASKTGKSAIIDIIDYCSGRSECNVADGVIRKHVDWYAVVFQTGESQVFVARKNPGPGERTSPDVYMERGATVQLPTASALFKNTTVSALEKFLGAAIGISENEHRPPAATRDPLEANFRHALLLCIQDQNDIDSKRRLFHRQGEEFVGQAIRDTFPYFLGAVDEDRLLKQAQLDVARRHLRQRERQLRDAESQDTAAYPRARALFEEAQQVGLLNDGRSPASHPVILAALRGLAQDDRVRDSLVVGDGDEALAKLRAERQGLRSDLEGVNAEIRSTRMFSSETNGYEREAKEQRARLSAVGLIRRENPTPHQCPLCDALLATPTPTVDAIARSLRDLNSQLEIVEAENPRLQARLASLSRQEAELEQSLRDNQQRIAARVRENEIQRVQQDTFILQARTAGKISQYIETSVNTDEGSTLRLSVQTAAARVATLEAELDVEATREKLNAFLNIIGKYMTEFSAELDLEHRGSQLRLDIRNLTVVADTLDGPVPLHRMGSGENWVGYHVLAHLALHKWFRQKERPVPGFSIFDQPSQAHYPPERDSDGSLDVLGDEDQAAVLDLFRMIAKAASTIAPHLQIIVMDHADLKEDWFDDAVVERWRGGSKLIPQEWIDNG